MAISAPHGPQPITGALAGFDKAAYGYDPAAVDRRVGALAVGLASAQRRVRELEAELARLQAGVPRVDPRPRSRVVADQVEAILRPAHEDARRRIAQAHAIAQAELEDAEARVTQLLDRVGQDATAADAGARAAGRILVAQAQDLAEEIRAQGVAAAARIAACAPEIVSAARRGAVQAATRSLAGLPPVPQPPPPGPPPLQPSAYRAPVRPMAVPGRVATANRTGPPEQHGAISGPRTADTILTITSST